MMAASAGTWRWVDDVDSALFLQVYTQPGTYFFLFFECVTFIRAAPCENVSAGNESQDQPAHPHSLIWTFTVCPLTESLEFTGE